MRNLRIIPLLLLVAILGFIGYQAIPKHPPVDAYIADLQEQCDSLRIYQAELLTRVKILEFHLDRTGE